MLVAGGPALAQALPDVPPPSRYLVDENGVDVARGTVTGTRTDLAIGGEGPAGLAVRQRFGYGERGHNYNYGLFVSGGVTYASVGLQSIPFTLSGSTYTVADGSGATLIKSGTTYTLTLSDGTIVVYDYGTKDHLDLNRFSRATSIAHPSGETETLTWVSVTWCSNLQDGCAGGTWLTGVRLQAVSSSMGYQLHYNYGRADVLLPNQATGWRRLDGVTAINTAVESCSPSAHSCTLTNTWPAVGYSGADVTDPAGRTSSYSENPSNQTYTIRRPSASTPNVTYSHTVAYNRLPVTQIVRDGLTWGYNYSVTGNTATMVVTLPGSPTRTRTIVSDLTIGLPTSVTNEVGQTTAYQYDSSGRLTRATAPEGNYVQYSYDSRGNVTQAQYVPKTGSGSPTLTVSASYPGSCSNPATCNQPTSTTDARGNTTDYTYNSTHGSVLTVTAPAPTTGAVRPQTRYTYSALTQPGGGSVYRVTQVSACQTTSSCTGAADEVRTTIAYGQANLQPTSITTASGNGSPSAASTIGYDYLARPITVDGPLSGTADTVRTRYNLAGQAIGTVSPDPDGAGSLKHRAQRTTYNSDGQVSRIETGTVDSQSDADWAAFAPLETVDIAYDSSARPIRQVLTGSDSAIHAVTEMSYDGASRPECVAQRMNPSAWGTATAACTQQSAGTHGPDRIVRTTYDLASRPTLVQTGYGVSGEVADVVATAYTNNGQVSHVTDAGGNRTTYEYDGHDRLYRTYMPSTTQGAGTSSTTDYEQLTLDANGNVTSRRLRNGQSIAYGYDNLNRLVLKDVPNATWQLDVSYTYDLLGRLTSATDGYGHAQTLAWDALGRLTSESDNWVSGAMASEYDAAGRRTSLSYQGGALVIGYTYDTAGNLTEIRENPSGGDVLLATYDYDSLGRRTSLTRGNGATTSYSYDAVSLLSQLVQNPNGTSHDVTFDYGYNPAGQIVSTTRSNDLYAWGGHYQVDRGYTADGLSRYAAAGAASFSYDANGNLTGDGTNSYSYDVENRLSYTNGTTYDPLDRLWAAHDAGFRYDGAHMAVEIDPIYGNTLRRHVFGPGMDEPLVSYDVANGSARSWHHADERGSVIALSNGSGNVTSVNAYDEYGIPASGNAGRFQYTGQAWLPHLRMQYSRARIYSPTLGRFMQTDPIGMAGGMNLYGYVLNDPVNFTDPSGLTPQICTGTRIVSSCQGQNGGVARTGSGPLPWHAGLFLGLNSGGSGGIIYVPGIPGPVTSSGSNVSVTASTPGYFYFAGGFGATFGDGGEPETMWGHHYRPYRQISEGRCNLSDTERRYLAQHFSTPFSPGTAAVNGRVMLFGGDPIEQRITNNGFTVVNQTLPGHRFHSGWGGGSVTRTPLIGRNGALYTSTIGIGTNYNRFLAGLNQLTGPIVFGLLDSAMADYVEESGICN